MQHKLLSLVLSAIIVCANTFSQPIIQKQKTIGSSDNDYLTGMDLTKDGGLIAGGYSLSNISADKTQISRGLNDYWIVKLDRLQNIQWDKTIGGNKDDYLYSLQQTNDGGYILGGHSFSNISGEKTDISRGSSDYWVIKLNNLGNIAWDKTIGGNKADRLHGVLQTIDGGYIVGGTSYSNISGEKTEETTIYSDFWIVKLDNSGNIQWDKTIGGNGEDYLKFLEQTPDGGYILGGTSSSNKSRDKTQNSRGLNDYWVVKLDKLGNIQWDKTIGGSDNEYLRSILPTADGGYILSGISLSDKSGEKSENSRGDADFWIVKINSSRNIEWDKTIGGNKEEGLKEGLNSLQLTSDGGYIIGGYSYSGISGEKTENSRGDADYWVVKLSSVGKIQWDKTIGGNKDDELSSINEYQINRYRLGGYSNSGISGDKTDASKGGYDYWIVYLNYKKTVSTVKNTSSEEYSNIQQNNHHSNNFIVYPNPAKEVCMYKQMSRPHFH